MKTVTKEQLKEIVAKAVELTASDYSLRDAEVSVTALGKGSIGVEIERMYEYVDINFDTLCKISEQLGGTKKIDITDRDFSSGCETCDYGSRYVIHLKIGDVQLVD